MRWLCLFLWCPVALAQQPITDFAVDHPSCASGKASVSGLETRRFPIKLHSPEQLVRMKECQLEAIYKLAQPGPIPHGYTPGLAIFKPGSAITLPLAKAINATAWQGKYFENETTMINRTFGLKAIRTVIYPGESFLDGRPSTVLDYCDAGRAFRRYRDEIREVAPGIYLGIMHRRDDDGPKRASWFTLDARTGKACVAGVGTE